MARNPGPLQLCLEQLRNPNGHAVAPNRVEANRPATAPSRCAGLGDHYTLRECFDKLECLGEGIGQAFRTQNAG